MILSFPSPVVQFEVCLSVSKDTAIRYAHFVSLPFVLVFQSPIDLKPHDQVWIDVRTSHVEIVERGGIAIYRSGWMN